MFYIELGGGLFKHLQLVRAHKISGASRVFAMLIHHDGAQSTTYVVLLPIRCAHKSL